MDLVISGIGAISWIGEGPSAIAALLGTPAAPDVEEVEEGLEVRIGRVGRLRHHPFSSRYKRFGQIDTFSRYAFVAAGHALDDAGLHVPAPEHEGCGAILGTGFGCQEANFQFDQFSLDPSVGLRGASPLMFKGTVDNAPAGWLSVAYHLRGVNATFTSGFGAGAEAVLAAATAIRADRTDTVACGGVERLMSLQLAALCRAGFPPRPFAAEGSAVVVLETAEAAARRGHTPRAKLLGAVRLRALDTGALARFLDRSGVAPGDVAAVRVATGPAFQREPTAPLFHELGITADAVVDSDRTGEMYAAQAPLSLVLLAADLPAGPALLYAAGEDGDAFAFVLAPTAPPGP
jgi:hypothetical protein